MTKECPRAKSDMTPCYRKDGELAVGEDSSFRSLCVGCDWSIDDIENEQKQFKKEYPDA